jgi:hypothetical protein
VAPIPPTASAEIQWKAQLAATNGARRERENRRGKKVGAGLKPAPTQPFFAPRSRDYLKLVAIRIEKVRLRPLANILRAGLRAQTERLGRVVPEYLGARGAGDLIVAADRPHRLVREFVDRVAVGVVGGDHQVIVADMVDENRG